MAQKVQVEVENCTEENLKRQGEKAAQLKSKNLQSELLEGINMTQVKEVTFIQDKSSSICISPTQANYEVISESTIENTRDCKSIYLFTKYGYKCKENCYKSFLAPNEGPHNHHRRRITEERSYQ
jgi:hypothetical protein